MINRVAVSYPSKSVLGWDMNLFKLGVSEKVLVHLRVAKGLRLRVMPKYVYSGNLQMAVGLGVRCLSLQKY